MLAKFFELKENIRERLCMQKKKTFWPIRGTLYSRNAKDFANFLFLPRESFCSYGNLEIKNNSKPF